MSVSLTLGVYPATDAEKRNWRGQDASDRGRVANGGTGQLSVHGAWQITPTVCSDRSARFIEFPALDSIGRDNRNPLGFAYLKVLGTAACTDKACGELGPGELGFGLILYGTPIVAVVGVLFSSFTARRRWGIVVPASGQSSSSHR